MSNLSNYYDLTYLHGLGVSSSVVDDSYENRVVRYDVRDLELDHEWLYGSEETKIQRLHFALDNNPGAYIFNPVINQWDGYNGEDTVIALDFDKKYSSMKQEMNQWTSGQPFQCSLKDNTQMVINPKKFIFTSERSPHNMWNIDTSMTYLVNHKINLIYFPSMVYRRPF